MDLSQKNETSVGTTVGGLFKTAKIVYHLFQLE